MYLVGFFFWKKGGGEAHSVSKSVEEKGNGRGGLQVKPSASPISASTIEEGTPRRPGSSRENSDHEKRREKRKGNPLSPKLLANKTFSKDLQDKGGRQYKLPKQSRAKLDYPKPLRGRAEQNDQAARRKTKSTRVRPRKERETGKGGPFHRGK